MNGTGRLRKPGLGLVAGLALIATIAGTAWAANFHCSHQQVHRGR
jgi:hypothetical protein